jgi:arylsulfatase A-like enzyme
VTVLLVVADGARPDTLHTAMQRGDLPEMARLAREGGEFTVSSCFPSVTGPAYAPFVCGRFPARIGLPGLRWFDRARQSTRWPSYSRSYVGSQMRLLDRDLSAEARTLFEHVGAEHGLASFSMLGRGLPARRHIGKSVGMLARVTHTHFRGNLDAWLRIDQQVADRIAHRVRRERPRYLLGALTGIDKASHSEGPESTRTLGAMRVVDNLVGELRQDAERRGTWERTQLWITSDHGHALVDHHDDLAEWAAAQGHKVVAHPRVLVPGAELAVMVSGNAMAHLYLDLHHRTRPWWPALSTRWQSFVDALLSRPSVDLLLVALDATHTLVRSRSRGDAIVVASRGRFDYRPQSGDPLQLGAELLAIDAADAHARCAATPYPDSVVQIADLAGASRSGDVIVSATPGHDFRDRFEPIPHRSTHGALHREHMLVPWLMNHAPRRTPRRTADIMPSSLAALGLPIPEGLDGQRVN